MKWPVTEGRAALPKRAPGSVPPPMPPQLGWRKPEWASVRKGRGAAAVVGGMKKEAGEEAAGWNVGKCMAVGTNGYKGDPSGRGSEGTEASSSDLAAD